MMPAAFGDWFDCHEPKWVFKAKCPGVSPPRIDPLGDYTERLFEGAERLRPGSGASLRARAVVLDTPPGSPPSRSGDTDADAILTGRVDVSIVYRSGRESLCAAAAERETWCHVRASRRTDLVSVSGAIRRY
jgi:hypothetical protein